MKIVLSGVETNNKGAELMLYAILQEIERRFPEAKIYLPYSRMKQGLGYVKTNMDFKPTPHSKIVYKQHMYGVFRHLHLPMGVLNRTNIVKDADWFIDGSGFVFSDQWDIKDWHIKMWQDMLCPLHKQGCKIVFLPQAFGPVEKLNTKKILKLLSDNADLIMPREQISLEYLQKSGVVNMEKVRMFTDFTSLVEGEFPLKYKHLRNGICIIPNLRMIDKGHISFDNYIKLIKAIIAECKKSGHPVYLLNHEGKRDATFCLKCKESICGDVEAVTTLNALEVKGLIASAYLVVTPRFHGLASALNTCVPSLATSWSHKYEELYYDYGLDNYVLPLDNKDLAITRVKNMLDIQKNSKIRLHLSNQVSIIKNQTQEMWNLVWNL